MKKQLITLSLLCLLLPSCSQNQNEMKELEVRKIEASNLTPENLSVALDAARIEYQPIDVINWEAHAYRPDVKFRIAYTGDAICLNYKVKENSIRARYGEDNGNVWTDSCVEFFVIPANDGVYYNFEFNCIGTMLIGAGDGRGARTRADKNITSKVLRWSSLGNQPFEERVGEVEWEISMIIPYSAFFRHQITSLEGKTIRANFYKCGDDLSTSHYLSWNPIKTEKPNFHTPEFFGRLKFK